MRISFKHFLYIFPVILALAAAVPGCTEVDPDFGNEYIPDGQEIRMRIDTVSGGIRTFTVTSDSLYTNYRGQMVIGSMQDVDFGTTHCGTIVQFYPLAESFDDDYYGHRPVADSAKLTLYLTKAYGKEHVEQTFHIYALTDTLPKDSVYYNNLDIDRIVDLSEPLFTFTMQNEPTTTVKPLQYGDKGQQYLDKIVNIDKEVLSAPFYRFHENFYGFYIAPAPDSPADAAVYQITLKFNDYYSLFGVYAHNYDEQTGAVKDTLNTFYLFDDSEPLVYPNMSVTHYQFEYTPQINAVLGDTLGDGNAIIYVQGFSGLAGYLKFTDELVENLQSLKNYNGTEYGSIVINQAQLYIQLEDFTTDAMDQAPSRLGLYSDYRGFDPVPVTEYMYYYNYNWVYNERFDGNINRSHGYYMMDISLLVTDLINNHDTTQTSLWLGPQMYAISEYYSQVRLKGSSSDQPMKLILTYTLTK